jgi:hypothetical protein
MFGFGSNSFIGDQHTMYEWCHNYNIVSDVDHPGFESNLAINDNGSRQYPKHGFCIKVSRDSANPTKC